MEGSIPSSQQHSEYLEQQHLFTDEEIFQPEIASVGQRFANFLIDRIVGYGLSVAFTWLLLQFLVRTNMELVYYLAELDTVTEYFYDYLIGSVVAIIYYTFTELVFKGQSLGKLVTGTRAIRDDGQPLTFRDALLRSLSRIVPFEPFSAFNGYPWHDTWTRTTVIKIR